MKKPIKINPDKFHKDQIKFYLVILPLIIVMMLPIIYVLFHAFKPADELFAFPPRFITLRPTLNNFKKLLATANQSNYPASLYVFNSVISTVVTVVATILMTAASGYVLSKKSFKGKKALIEINQGALMFVAVAVAIPRFLIVKNLGLMDSFLTHILPFLAMPVGLFLVKQFIDQVPSSLVEAAQIDGCTDYGILFKIIIPIIKPALATVAILSFQNVWNSVEASQLFIDSEKIKTFAYYLSTVTSPSSSSVSAQGMAAAGVLIMFVPNIILFITMQSKVMNTVAHSGIK